MTRRTKARCKNPAAYGCASCRMHGAHKSRNVLRGINHPKYRNGGRTKKAEIRHRESSITLLLLRDIGDEIGMFNGSHTRGRKPKGYEKLIPNNLEGLLRTALKNKLTK